MTPIEALIQDLFRISETLDDWKYDDTNIEQHRALAEAARLTKRAAHLVDYANSLYEPLRSMPNPRRTMWIVSSDGEEHGRVSTLRHARIVALGVDDRFVLRRYTDETGTFYFDYHTGIEIRKTVA